MARNLTRNTKVYVSTADILTNGIPDLTKVSSSNTYELKVLDGYSYSQGTQTQDITISEAGTSPIRGQKTFNTAQDPVEISVPTYVRPYINNASLVDAPEKILWASLTSSVITVNTNGDMVDNIVGNGMGVYQSIGSMLVDFEESDSNELAKLVFWFKLENTVYRVDNVNISGAEIDFSIDGISTITWSGNGTSLTEITGADFTTISNWVPGSGGVGDYVPVPASTSNSFLRNKLSTLQLKNNKVDTAFATVSGTADATSTDTVLVDAAVNQLTSGAYVGDYLYIQQLNESRVIIANDTDTITVDKAFSTAISSGGSWYVIPANKNAGQEYSISITGGSITIENNMDFLTPEELGVVNKPLPGFAGSRAITGTITAYLNTGNYGTSALLQDSLDSIDSATNSYSLTLHMGGAPTAPKRVQFSLNTAQLSVPSVNVEDVISTEITFAGQGSNGLIENRDELVVEYFSN